MHVTVHIEQDQLEDGAHDLAYILRALADDITAGDGFVYRIADGILSDPDDGSALCRYSIS